MEESSSSSKAGNVKRFYRFIGVTVATAFGTGFFPLGPGTVGSLVSAGIFLITPDHIRFTLLPGILLTAWAGCEAGRRFWGEDPSKVTVDELAGCWIACLAAPVHWGYMGIAAAFLLFRIFDIFKPWPVNVLDRMKSSLGILLDDVAAGFMAAAVLILADLLV